jgi:predicted DNA binding protein
LPSRDTRPASTPTPQVSSAVDTAASTARFTLPAEGFALAEFFERVPDARVECESAVANPTDHALLVVQADSREKTVDTALRADSSIATVERFGERADEWVYRVAWEGRPRRLIQRLVAADVTLMSARGRGGEWQLRLLAPNREGIGRAHEIMDDLGCGDRCRSISSLDGDGSNRSGLTDDQHEALIEGFEAGYYDVPRKITLEEVATSLGISHQALSERFRRAYRSLIATELVVTKEEEL